MRVKALTTLLAVTLAISAVAVWHVVTTSPSGALSIARPLSGAGRTAVVPPPCVNEGIFGCFLPGPTTSGSFITPQDLTSITKQLGTPGQAKHRTLMQQMFADYRTRLQTMLAGPAFSGITDEGLAAAFAVTASYELKQPTISDPSLDLNVIMSPKHSSYGLVCQGYVALADQLFYLIKPKPSSTFQLQIIGIGRDSPLDNHVTMATTGTGVALLLDPTTSIIAAGGSFDLLERKSMTYVQFPARDDSINSIGGFRSQLETIVRTGSFDYRTLTYAFPGTALKYAKRQEDFINLVSWENIPNRQGLFFLTVPGDYKHGVIWQLTAGGLAQVSTAGIASMVAVDQGIFALGLGGTLWEYTSTGAAVIQQHVAQVASGPSDSSQSAPGPNNKAIYVLSRSGGLSLYDTNLWHTVNHKGTRAVVGTGDSTFILMSSGTLYQATPAQPTQPWILVGHGYDGIGAGYPSRLDMGSNPVCTKVSPCNGELYAHRTAAYGLGIIMRHSSGVQQVIATNVSGWGISPLRGISVNMLVGTQIYRWDSPAVPDSVFAVNGPAGSRYRNITGAGWKEVGQPWQPAMPTRGINVSSMSLIGLNLWVQAISSAGSVYTITTGTF